MDILGEYRINASQQSVWEALNDPQVLRQCIPGCEQLDRDGDNAFTATINAKVGPVSARFKTRLTVENSNAPVSYTLVGEGKGGAAGFGKGSADVSLEESGSATVLSYNARFSVGGKLAQVGSRLVQGAARKTADQFFLSFSEYLGGGSEAPADREAVIPAGVGGPAPGPEASRKGFRPWLWIGVVLALFLIIWLLIR